MSALDQAFIRAYSHDKEAPTEQRPIPISPPPTPPGAPVQQLRADPPNQRNAAVGLAQQADKAVDESSESPQSDQAYYVASSFHAFEAASFDTSFTGRSAPHPSPANSSVTRPEVATPAAAPAPTATIAAAPAPSTASRPMEPVVMGNSHTRLDGPVDAGRGGSTSRERRPLSAWSPGTSVAATFQPALEVDRYMYSETVSKLSLDAVEAWQGAVESLRQAMEHGRSVIG
ncbi:MAG: hypothetical protein KDA61_16785, partial [Planctomycetales bacterium]|nr:hypothetical protein [Planctomycetales bacterium]